MDRLLRLRTFAFGLFSLALGTASAHASDAGHGKDLFTARCSICHTANQGGPNKLGPNLFGVVGRHSGSLANFNYSSAMRGANLTWSPDILSIYLAGPQKLIPGVRMTFTGFANTTDAQDVIAFLEQQK